MIRFDYQEPTTLKKAFGLIDSPRCGAEMIMSLAQTRYNFSTPEIRMLLRHVLSHAPSGRTIKRLARSAGHKLKRGWPLTTPKVHKGDLNNLVELTSNGLEAYSGNSLQFFIKSTCNSA